MGVGKNWLSDLEDNSENLKYNSRESSMTVSSVMRRGWRKPSKDCWGCSCSDAIVGCLCPAECRDACAHSSLLLSLKIENTRWDGG